MNTIFTVTNYAYLYKALALKKSIELNTNYSFNIYLFEEKVNVPKNQFENDYIFVSDLDIPNYYKLAFKYDVVEFTTSLKPTLTLLLLKDFEKVIFLDPDVFVFNDVKPVFEELNTNPVLLTPHYLIPQSHKLKYPDLDCLKYGSYNLGFFAVNNSSDSITFLKWWENKCLNQCYFETQNGLSTDQKWIIIAQCFFRFIKNLDHPGLNVAYWNANERIIKKQNLKYFVNEKPLIFMHFSNFNNKKSELLSSRSEIKFSELENTKIWVEIFDKYRLTTMNIKKLIPTLNYEYSYEKISKYYLTSTLKRFYGENSERFLSENPFKDKDLLKFAKKHKLISTKKTPRNLNEKNVSGWKLKIVLRLYRFFLKLIGHNNSINVSRFLIYLSSPHRIKNFY